MVPYDWEATVAKINREFEYQRNFVNVYCKQFKKMDSNLVK